MHCESRSKDSVAVHLSRACSLPRVPTVSSFVAPISCTFLLMRTHKCICLVPVLSLQVHRSIPVLAAAEQPPSSRAAPAAAAPPTTGPAAAAAAAETQLVFTDQVRGRWLPCSSVGLCYYCAIAPIFNPLPAVGLITLFPAALTPGVKGPLDVQRCVTDGGDTYIHTVPLFQQHTFNMQQDPA